MMSGGLFDQAIRNPDNVAIVHDDTPITYGAFARRIEVVRRRLAGYALRPGGIAVVCGFNLLDGWLVALALRRLGLTTVAIRYPSEVGLLGLRQIAAIVVGESEALGGLPDGGALRVIRVSRDALDGAADDEPSPGPGDIPSGGHLVLTSGTTGKIKKVLIDSVSEPGHLNQRASAFRIDRNTVFNVFNWGLWTSIGHIVPLAVWALGGRVILRRPNTSNGPPPAFTHAIASPAMVAELLANAAQGPWEGAPRFFVGGGRMSEALAAETIRRLTPNLLHIFASTEAGVWCMTPIGDPKDVATHQPVPGRVVQVVGEDGSPLPPEQVGLIRVDALPNAASYYEDEEATRAWFRDGWFYSGDIGLFDGQGRLTVQGRFSDVVVVGGVKLAAEMIEAPIQRQLSVGTVGVFSTPGSEPTDELHVVFERGQRPDVETLRALAATALKDFPKVHFHQVDVLPRNDRGKMQRFVLKQRILETWAAREIPRQPR